jgi:hypothetical protein
MPARYAWLKIHVKIHWPVAFRKVDEKERFPINPDTYLLDIIDVPAAETWKAMEEMVKKGKVKSIGVSNFTTDKIEEVWDAAEIKPVVNQIEMHPYLQQASLIEWCQNKVSRLHEIGFRIIFRRPMGLTPVLGRSFGGLQPSRKQHLRICKVGRSALGDNLIGEFSMLTVQIFPAEPLMIQQSWPSPRTWR